MSKRRTNNSNLNVGDIVYATSDGKVNKVTSSDPTINQLPIGTVTSTSPLCTMTINHSSGYGSGGSGGGSVSMTAGSGGTGTLSSHSSISNSSFESNCYCSTSDFIYDVVSNQLMDNFSFYDQCLIDLVKELINNPNTRSFINLHMPILMLKSNDVGVFILDAVVKKLESDNE